MINTSSETLIKVCSIVVHFDEYTSNGGSPIDLLTAQAMIELPDVRELLSKMDKMQLLPSRRDGKSYREPSNDCP